MPLYAVNGNRVLSQPVEAIVEAESEADAIKAAVADDTWWTAIGRAEHSQYIVKSARKLASSVGVSNADLLLPLQESERRALLELLRTHSSESGLIQTLEAL